MRKPIEGYEGQYSIDRDGQVYSTPVDGKPNRTLKQEIVTRSNTTYRRVSLSKDGKVKRFQVHQLVAKAFIYNPSNYTIVNHKDNDGSNNNVDNLEWCTQKQNIAHAKQQKRHIPDDPEACSAAGHIARERSKVRAKLRWDAYVGTTFKNRTLLSILEYGKHPKGSFLCLSCNTQFSAAIADSIKPRDPDAFLGCRSCSQTHKRRKDIV